MDDLLLEFIAETREMLAAIGGELVAWEADPVDRSRLDAIFRFVHTVKGSCGFIDLPRLERLSHAAEDALADLRDGRRVSDKALVSAVLAIVDRIGDLVDAIEAGEALPDGDDHVLIAALSPGATETAPATPAPQQAGGASRGIARSVRLPVDLLDRLMAGISDMVLARNDVAHRLRDAAVDGPAEAAFQRLTQCVADMRDTITRTRMQRIDGLFAVLPRVVRDLAADMGKEIALDVGGGDVELDREMVEMIRDPLTHILRNAIDHGIERPEDRLRQGKSQAGRLQVSARQAGNEILIEVSDDGRGIDAEALAARAVANGLLTRPEADRLAHAGRLELMFEPGISTAKQVTEISGRGVGMDVVRANVERIGGTVEIDSTPDVGTTITLSVPLTLTIIPTLTLSAGGRRFAMPRAAVEEIVRAGVGDVRLQPIAGSALAHIRGRRLPVISLAGLMDTSRSAPDDGATLMVLKPARGAPYAIAVDAVHDHEELVIKPASPAVMSAGIYAGTTLGDDGCPMLLLDPVGIARVAGVKVGSDASEPDAGAAAAPPPREQPQHLLFRDLDGFERAVPLEAVERIEDVPASAVAFTAGQLRLASQGQIVPLFSRMPPAAERPVRVIRLGDGARQLAYAIADVLEVVTLSGDMQPALEPGAVGGVAMLGERQVEVVDAEWLLRSGGSALPGGERSLTLLAGADDRWVAQVLRPLAESAGYRVAMGEVAGR